MGTPAPDMSENSATPVEAAVAEAVSEAAPDTLAEIAQHEDFEGVWHVVRQKGSRLYLSEVPNTTKQPYDTTAGFAPFGPETYFFGSVSSAAEATSDTCEVVPVRFTARVEG